MMYEKPNVSVIGTLEELTGSRYAGRSYDEWYDYILPKGGPCFDVDNTEVDKTGGHIFDSYGNTDYPA